MENIYECNILYINVLYKHRLIYYYLKSLLSGYKSKIVN